MEQIMWNKSFFRVVSVLLALLLCMGTPMSIQAAENTDITIGATEIPLQPIGEANLLYNGGFESVEDNKPLHWGSRCFNQSDGTGVSLVSSDKTANGNCIKLVGGTGKASYPYVSQLFTAIGNATYQLHLRVRKDSGTAEATAKLEMYSTGPTIEGGYKCLQGSNTVSVRKTDGWEDVYYNFVAPFAANSIAVMPRLESENKNEEVLVDDVAVYMVRPPDMLEIKTDSTFYYPEQTSGTATAHVLTEYFPEAIGGQVSFVLTDGDTVLHAETVALSEQSEACFSFDAGLLKEFKKEYLVKGILTKEDGTVLAEARTPIYKFTRPTHLGEDGVWREKDGTPFTPVIAYHVDPKQYAKCAEAGITVVQGNVSNLTAAAQYGLKVLVTLYEGMKPAANAVNLEKTKSVVESYKDDERIFAWAVMDEPFLNLANPEPELRESYRVIRSLDDNHPVYICEASPEHYEASAKNVDILCIDPYLPKTSTGKGQMDTAHVYNYVNLARKSTKGLKPVLSLLQAFEWYGYMPDAMAERHMIYQSLMAGAVSHGYYTIAGAMERNDVKIPLYNVTETDIWDGLVSFKEKEQGLVYKHFVEKEYPGLFHHAGEELMYHGFVKDGKVYVMVMNQNKTNTVNASIPLVSFDESIKITEWTAEYVAGAEGENMQGTEATLRLSLAPYAAVLLAVTPLNDVRFSGLHTKTVQNKFWNEVNINAGLPALKEKAYFSDLDSYPWAQDAIEELYREKIIEEASAGSFLPATPIKRGEFAVYLARTLGLFSEKADEFKEIPDTSSYKEAIAAGKAYGIFHSEEDNTFLPEAPLSAEDMMNWIAQSIEMQKTKGAKVNPILETEDVPEVFEIALQLHLNRIKATDAGVETDFSCVTKAEACVALYQLFSFEKKKECSDTVFFVSCMNTETKEIFLQELLSENINTEDGKCFVEWSKDGRRFGLYVNGSEKGQTVEMTRDEKAICLLAAGNAAKAAFKNKGFSIMLPTDSFIFAEYPDDVPIGAYKDDLMMPLVENGMVLKGDKYSLGGLYRKTNDTWILDSLCFKGTRLSLLENTVYKVKSFDWSAMLVLRGSPSKSVTRNFYNDTE